MHVITVTSAKNMFARKSLDFGTAISSRVQEVQSLVSPQYASYSAQYLKCSAFSYLVINNISLSSNNTLSFAFWKMLSNFVYEFSNNLVIWYTIEQKSYYLFYYKRFKHIHFEHQVLNNIAQQFSKRAVK